MSVLSAEVAGLLRALVGADRLRVLKALPGLLGGVASLCAGQAERSPRDHALLAETALRLLVLARTLREVSLVQRTLHTLAGMGRFGQALVSLYAQSRALPLAQVGPILSTLPARDFLAVLNELLLDCPPADKQYAAWLKTLLPAPGKTEAKEHLQFLKGLAEAGTPLAPLLREAILADPVTEAIARTLADGQGAGTPGPATMEALLAACSVLDTPGLAEHAWTYALRTAGGSGPSRLGPLLAASHELEERDTALAREMRRLADREDAPALLALAARGEPETLGLVLADMLGSGPGPATKAAQLVPLLPQRGVDACLEALPPEALAAKQAVLELQFAALVRTEPDFLRRYVKAQQSPLPGPVMEALKQCLAVLPAPPLAEPEALPPLPGPEAAPWMGQPAGRQPLAELLKDSGPLKDLNLAGQALSGAQLAQDALDGRNLSCLDLSRGRFEGLTLRRSRLASCGLAGAQFSQCTFQGVTFSGCDLSRARFSGCGFEGCCFEGCDMHALVLHKCSLSGCAFTECTLLGADFTETRLSHAAARASVFSALRLRTCAVLGGEFSRCDLSGGYWVRTAFRNAVFEACSLAATALAGCEATGTRMARNDLRGLRMQGGHTDDPHLFSASQESLARAPVQPLPALPPALRQGAGADFVRACVRAWLRVDDARRTLAAMRAQNRRRRLLTLERLGEQGQFLRLLPLVLATDAFDKAQGLFGVPHCVLADRALERGPTPADLDLLAKAFPRHQPTPKPQPTLSIGAVYAIGSLGTMAQKPSSDVDCWVCYTALPGAPADAAAGLRRKLAALEGWAMQQFGLEVHFFAMTVDEVRANAFGMSDKESSGSAQALLLKEEFYRTALKLAGRDLAWWAAPPGADDDATRAMLTELAVLDPRLSGELIDLGQPAAIPPGEYFGACLWQMVKALHSPYKSVMKLGLLEKYAGQGEGMRLLCERIKEAALRGRSRLEDLDPYLALFASISKHYEQLGDAMGLGLVAECLLLKADVAQADLPPQLVRHCAEQMGCQDASSFANSMRLGAMVGRFMIEAYRRIQEGLRAGAKGGGAAANITPQDLTRLGRRIAVNFAPGEHKVGLVPFLSEGLAFTELFFYAEKAPGKRTIWAVKGKERSTGKAAVESLAPIRRDTDVVRLLAWLLINGIYDPDLAVQAEKSFAPIAVMDLQALLADLAAFFPRRETLDPDMDQYLEAEHVTRAYFILNLPIAPDKNKILHASVVYATSWGELCCQSFDNPSPLLAKSPVGFLRENLAKPVAGDVECRAFAPKKSACPRLKFV